MTTAIDTNVIIALWDRDDAVSTAAQSALDAALTVRSYNQRIASNSALGHMRLRYDAKVVDGALTRYLTLSVPLDYAASRK